MSACEKCWNDAYFESRLRGGSQVDHYKALLKEREANPCTPEQQERAVWFELVRLSSVPPCARRLLAESPLPGGET